jgi:hypothetical protein
MKRANASRIAVLVLCGLMLAGCSKRKFSDEEVTQNPLKPNPGGAPAQSFVQRAVERPLNQNILRNIGGLYVAFRAERGRPPKDLQEFLAYLTSDPNTRGGNETKVLEAGTVVMVFNPQLSGNQVLAYEKEAFQQLQNRLVLFGDGNSVKMLTEPEFQAALKGQ